MRIDETQPPLDAQLIEVGVPAHVAAYLEQLKPQAWIWWGSQWALRRLSGETNPKAYVRRAVVNWQGWMAGSAIILLAISAYAVSRDVQAHGIYTRSHYIDSPFFPWGSRTPTPWTEAVKVELGCNHVTGRNASDSLIYRVHFPDRYFVSVESGVAFGDWLQAAEEIDAELRRSRAEFRRWNWLDRDPLAPACLNVMRRSFEQDYPRIERLLRIGELPDR